MVGHLTLLRLCPQVVERHHSLISFASGECSAPQISCKWAHSSLVPDKAQRVRVVCCSVVCTPSLCKIGFVQAWAKAALCFSSGLTGTRSLPLHPQFGPGMDLVVWVGFQVDGARKWSFLLAHDVSVGVCLGHWMRYFWLYSPQLFQ